MCFCFGEHAQPRERPLLQQPPHDLVLLPAHVDADLGVVGAVAADRQRVGFRIIEEVLGRQRVWGRVLGPVRRQRVEILIPILGNIIFIVITIIITNITTEGSIAAASGVHQPINKFNRWSE